jgi:hypothetical protein
MDLLRIQDTLKNASDQQLMQMMQAPDSTAPSYLVLSEIRRRKDMRSKQVPEEGSNRTVAEDLTAPEDQGIRGMQMPEQAPPGMDGQAGIQAMREGGVVRMQAGGSPAGFGVGDPVIFGRPLSSYSLPELERLTQGRAVRGVAPLSSAGAARRFDEETGESIPSNQAIIQRRIAQLRSRTEQPFPEEEPIREALSPLEPAGIRAIAPQPATVPQATEAPQPESALPIPPPETTAIPPLPAARQEPGMPEGQNQPRPVSGPAQPRSGIAAPSDAAPSGAGAPTFAGMFRENEALFSDGIAGLRERAREERVDPEARRNQAVNMALIEAGLRIAGSRNPSLMGAIGEGALPAVQSYNQQLGQIRTEQREARRDELEMAKQELNRQFSIGQISAAQYRTQMDNINANMRAASAERAASIRAGAAEAGADRRAQAALELERLRAANRPIDVSGIPALIAETGREIRDVRTRLSALGPRPAELDSRGRPNPLFQNWVASGGGELASQLQELEQQRNQYQRMFTNARPGLSTPGQTGAAGTIPLPSGGRIENGRYIPAGS